MELDNLKFNEIRELMAQLDEFKYGMQKMVLQAPEGRLSAVNANDINFWEIGKSYFVRTVTMYCVGRLKNISPQELLFESASWVADCGRFHEAQKTGKLNEVEPFVNDIIVNRGSIIDATLWLHPLPDKVIE